MISHGQMGIAHFPKTSGMGKRALPSFLKDRSWANGHCKCPIFFTNGRAKSGTGMRNEEWGFWKHEKQSKIEVFVNIIISRYAWACHICAHGPNLTQWIARSQNMGSNSDPDLFPKNRSNPIPIRSFPIHCCRSFPIFSDLFRSFPIFDSTLNIWKFCNF